MWLYVDPDIHMDAKLAALEREDQNNHVALFCELILPVWKFVDELKLLFLEMNEPFFADLIVKCCDCLSWVQYHFVSNK